MTTPDQPCHLAGMHPADCPAYVAGIATLRERVRAASAWPDAAAHADMRIEVVKRELNQGALAGFDSAVTDYAARLVIAALDSYEASALQLTYERGVAEGRRQATEGWQPELAAKARAAYGQGFEEGRELATEGWDREWLVDHPPYGGADRFITEGLARQEAARTERPVLSRLVGPWEPAEQATPSCTCPMIDVTNVRADGGEGIRTFMQGLDPACPTCVRRNAEQDEDDAHMAAMEERHQHEAEQDGADRGQS